MKRLFTEKHYNFLATRNSKRSRLSTRRRGLAAAFLGLLAALLLAALVEGSALAAEPATEEVTGNTSPAAEPASAGEAQPPAIEATNKVQSEAGEASPAVAASSTAPAATPAPSLESSAATVETEKKSKVEDEDEDEEKDNRRGPGALIGGDDKKMAFGGYGGVTALGTWISRTPSLLLGLEGGLLLDHRLAIGLAGFALSSRVEGPRFSNGNESLLGFGYGGLSLRYQFVCEGPIYASFGSLIGGGVIALFERSDDDTLEFNEDEQSANGFLVIEPSAQVHANLTHWMRLGLNGSYRFVHGVNSYGYEEKDLRGFSFGGHLQFGWF